MFNCLNNFCEKIDFSQFLKSISHGLYLNDSFLQKVIFTRVIHLHGNKGNKSNIQKIHYKKNITLLIQGFPSYYPIIKNHFWETYS